MENEIIPFYQTEELLLIYAQLRIRPKAQFIPNRPHSSLARQQFPDGSFTHGLRLQSSLFAFHSRDRHNELSEMSIEPLPIST